MNGILNRSIINVVSGKGGTGKTLLVSVLADMLGNAPNAPVVVVDLDVFVRGLTSLLYFHREERLHIASDKDLVVADFFSDKLTQSRAENLQLAIAQYRSFKVVPAVSRIDQLLNFRNLVPDTRDEARKIVGNILAQIPDEYRFVILDSRAGYDELIAATHDLSDVSICVEEEDPISRITADNLISQLQPDSKTPLFRIVNKGRDIRTEADLERMSRSVTDLGVIPFDKDVMNSFGSADFWEVIGRSLYRAALVRCWNRLAGKLRLNVELKSHRISPIGSERLESLFGSLALFQRVFFTFGILTAILGLGYGLVGQQYLSLVREDPLRSTALLMGLVGLGFAVSAFLWPSQSRRQDR